LLRRHKDADKFLIIFESPVIGIRNREIKYHKYFKKISETIKFGQIKFPHSLHSKTKNIECTKCHASTDFSKIVIKKEACTSCHHKGSDIIKDCSKCHSLQSGIFNGSIGSKKFDPDIMKSGGVDCDGCHISNNSVTRIKQNACGDCHSASYQSMLSEWKTDITAKVKTLSSLANSVKKGNINDENRTNLEWARKIISVIQSDGSKGVHNYMTFSDLLDKSIKELNKLK